MVIFTARQNLANLNEVKMNLIVKFANLAGKSYICAQTDHYMKYVKLYVSLLHGPELSCEYSLLFYPTSWTILTALLDKICPTLMGKTIIHKQCRLPNYVT